MQIAILGAGPSGCYMAQFLKRELPAAQIVIIDQLPTPYGLLRYGVAPDHVGTKQLTYQFSRQIERNQVDFLGHITVPDDLPLQEIEKNFDVLVCATGLSADRKLGVPGEFLNGIWGSGKFIRFLNDHPLTSHANVFCGKEVIVVGNGNVAIDVLRMLAKTSLEFEGSELSEFSLRALNSDIPRVIHLIGRSAAHKAKFDVVMLKELQQLNSVEFSFAHSETRKYLHAHIDDPISATLLELVEQQPKRTLKKVVFHFNSQIVSFEGEQVVQGVVLREGAETSRVSRVSADTVITAIGYERENNDVSSSVEKLSIPVFKAGWCATGPRGKIPDNRIQARELAQRIAVLQAQKSPSSKPGVAGIRAFLDKRNHIYTDYVDWKRIDEWEVRDAPKGRVRKKIRTIPKMLEVAKRKEVIKL